MGSVPTSAAASAAITVLNNNGGDAKRLEVCAKRFKEPLCPRQPGMIGSIFKSVARLSELNKPDTESRDPLVLLGAQVPLTNFPSKYGMDITELINDHGVNINDFFKNGYKMSDLCDAFSSRMNPEEGMDVLYYLGIDAEHFRVCPDLVQPEILKKRLGYDPRMLTQLGYQYTPQSSWTIPDMIRVGLTMPIVMDVGLTHAQDWARLKATATSPTQLTTFGCTRVLESQLSAPVPVQQQVIYAQPALQQQQQAYHAKSANVAPVCTTNNNNIGSSSSRVNVPGVALSQTELESIRRSRDEQYNGPKLVSRTDQSPFKLLLLK